MASSNKPRVSDSRVVGLLPAAGRARRMGPIPCSKEILPVPSKGKEGNVDGEAIGVVSLSALRSMSSAGIVPVQMVLTSDKHDVMRYWGGGSDVGVRLSYHLISGSRSVAITVDAAYPFVRDRDIAFAFPDAVYVAEGMFERLLQKKTESAADIVLALFPVSGSGHEDTVNVTAEGVVREIVIDSASSTFPWTWGAALWTPRFSELIHTTLHSDADRSTLDALTLGELMTHAQRKRMKIDGVTFEEGSFKRVRSVADWKSLQNETTLQPATVTPPRSVDSAIPAVQTTRQPD